MTEDRCFGKPSSEPMTFATFQAFEVFLDFLTILRLFDDFLTDLPPPSTSSYLTALWVALVDDSIDELVLSIEVRGTGRQIDLGASDDNSSTFDNILTDLPPASTSSTSCLPTGSALFLPPPPTPTTPFLGSADSVLEVFSIEVSGAAIRLNLDEPPVKFGESKEDLDVSY